jgi:DNA (cytosine-5)-methyltransferase 1
MSSGQGNSELASNISTTLTTLTTLHEAPIVSGTLTGTPKGDTVGRKNMLVAHALRADGFDASEDGTGRGTPLVIAFDTTQITSPENRSNPQSGDPCHPLATSAHPPALAYRWAASPTQSMTPSDVAPSLQATRNGEPATAVRRLTPRECERLQGFTDDYTAIRLRGKPAADGPRYKALGNSMAVPCMRWIGERIAAVEAIA